MGLTPTPLEAALLIKIDVVLRDVMRKTRGGKAATAKASDPSAVRALFGVKPRSKTTEST